MNLPPVVSKTEWQAAREALLAEEKEATRARDALAAKRRRLPMVQIDKDYVFHGPDGKASLLDLFEGRVLSALEGGWRDAQDVSPGHLLENNISEQGVQAA